MRDQILALFAAAAVGLAPPWAGASEHRGEDSRTDEAVASRPAPSWEELAGATYPGFEDQGPITLSAGKWEGPPLIEGRASVPALWLSEGLRLTGDLDQDGADEAVVHLTYSSGGTGNFGYLAVLGREGGEVVQKAIGLIGDRVQVRAARIDGRSIVLDVLQAGPDDGMCCPRQLATRTFGIQSGKLVETDIKVTGTASLAMLDGTAWVLRKLDGQEGKALPGQATLAFASGKVSGSTGCNRFHGTVSEGESATSLVIGPLITTRMACAEPLMAQEHAFLEKLGQAGVFQFLFGDLVLSGANGALVFSPQVD
jgi:heat shock protein HslJ